MSLPIFDGDQVTGADRNKNLIHEVHEQKRISVTDSTSSVSYTASRIKHVIRNVGSDTAYVNFDAAADTDDNPVNAGKIRTFYGSASAVHAICDTGETADLRILAFGDA